MKLKNSRFGLFYGCTRWPACDGTHGAHPDGKPLGTPADAKTKRWRGKAHAQFDKLWQGPGAEMSRFAAYRWLRSTLGLSEDEGHIGKFSIAMCQRLIAALEAKAQLDAINPPPDRKQIQRRREEKQARRRKRQAKRKQGDRP